LDQSYVMKYAALLLIVTAHASSCVLDMVHVKNLIRIENLSSRPILTYLREDNRDSVLSIDDAKGIYSNARDTSDAPESKTVFPKRWRYCSSVEYCNEKIWSNNVKRDTLLLFIIDRDNFLKTKNINASKLKLIYLTYGALIRDSCIVKYCEL
jgi:hypothetical protein